MKQEKVTNKGLKLRSVNMTCGVLLLLAATAMWLLPGNTIGAFVAGVSAVGLVTSALWARWAEEELDEAYGHYWTQIMEEIRDLRQKVEEEL